MLLQLIAVGIILGCEYALLAVGWGLIFKVTQTFHFAHGVVYTLGAYFAFLAVKSLNLALGPSLILGILGAALVGAGFEILLYRPLRRRGTPPMSVLIASLGSMIVLEMVIVLLVGDGPQSVSYNPKLMKIGSKVFFTSIQVYTVAVGVILVAATLWFLSKTRTGRIMEAVASNRELSELVGMNSDRIYVYCFVIGSGLAGVSAVLALLTRGIDPFVGTMAGTMAFIAVVVGGARSILGGAIGGFILGMAINLCVAVFPTEWQFLLAFAVVIVILVIRPEGILSR
jgi:branched-chain amino acid transport system permease protein